MRGNNSHEITVPRSLFVDDFNTRDALDSIRRTRQYYVTVSLTRQSYRCKGTHPITSIRPSPSPRHTKKKKKKKERKRMDRTKVHKGFLEGASHSEWLKVREVTPRMGPVAPSMSARARATPFSHRYTIRASTRSQTSGRRFLLASSVLKFSYSDRYCFGSKRKEKKKGCGMRT